MADLATVINNMRAQGAFNLANNDPRVQFLGPRSRRYLFAELMPESPRENNQYDEEDYNVLDLIASDVDAYSAPPFKGSFVEAVPFNVKMGDSGLATQMSTKLYSTVTSLLGRSASMERVAQEVLNFNGVLLNSTLTYNERQRCNAVVNGLVERKVGQVTESINYPNASGQRTALATVWSNDAVDPMLDIFPMLQRSADLGFSGIRRIISTTRVTNILLGNANMARRVGNVQIVGTQEYQEYADADKMNAYFRRNRLPAIETYDETYRDQAGTYRFIPDDVMIFIFDTGRGEPVDLSALASTGEIYVPDEGELGYTGIGTTAGHEDQGPGRWSNLVAHEGARPHVMGEIVQKSLPVFTEPNGFALFSAIT